MPPPQRAPPPLDISGPDSSLLPNDDRRLQINYLPQTTIRTSNAMGDFYKIVPLQMFKKGDSGELQAADVLMPPPHGAPPPLDISGTDSSLL
ncbi:hypothetical protein L6452_15292 [Arctium lappa]|uniref:Uncharacterized protein n=1 Tax=Arctium lappa TaxID=4217 RepID=A0ACB9CN78_ARCLA|nr:hypothetical protein L6452_15292 [Arctium lappa]